MSLKPVINPYSVSFIIFPGSVKIVKRENNLGTIFINSISNAIICITAFIILTIGSNIESNGDNTKLINPILLFLKKKILIINTFSKIYFFIFRH